MKNIFLISLCILPIMLIGQRNKLPALKPELWVNAGLTPLERGLGLYGKTQLNITETMGFDLGLSYGFSNPRNRGYYLSDIHSQGGSLSLGMVIKTRDFNRNGTPRKLHFLLIMGAVAGQNLEKAHYYFKGVDFKDYTSETRFKQRYNFLYPQLTLGLTYSFKESWNLQAGPYFLLSDLKNYKGKQQFELRGTKANAYFGYIGLNIGIGYRFWQKMK